MRLMRLASVIAADEVEGNPGGGLNKGKKER